MEALSAQGAHEKVHRALVREGEVVRAAGDVVFEEADGLTVGELRAAEVEGEAVVTNAGRAHGYRKEAVECEVRKAAGDVDVSGVKSLQKRATKFHAVWAARGVASTFALVSCSFDGKVIVMARGGVTAALLGDADVVHWRMEHERALGGEVTKAWKALDEVDEVRVWWVSQAARASGGAQCDEAVDCGGEGVSRTGIQGISATVASGAKLTCGVRQEVVQRPACVFDDVLVYDGGVIMAQNADRVNLPQRARVQLPKPGEMTRGQVLGMSAASAKGPKRATGSQALCILVTTIDERVATLTTTVSDEVMSKSWAAMLDVATPPRMVLCAVLSFLTNPFCDLFGGFFSNKTFLRCRGCVGSRVLKNQARGGQ